MAKCWAITALFQKQAPYEPSIHIPLIVTGPGVCGGVVSDALVELFDLNPTICALASVEPAPDMDARSFDGVLSGEVSEHRQDILIAMSNYRGIRNQRHKFVENSDDMPELYDLINDPKETLNIADEQSDQVAVMSDRLKQFFFE